MCLTILHNLQYIYIKKRLDIKHVGPFQTLTQHLDVFFIHREYSIVEYIEKLSCTKVPFLTLFPIIRIFSFSSYVLALFYTVSVLPYKEVRRS